MKTLQHTVILFLCVVGVITCREDASVSRLLTNAEALVYCPYGCVAGSTGCYCNTPWGMHKNYMGW